MSTRKIILGVCIVCLAIGSAYAAYLNLFRLKIRIFGITIIEVTLEHPPICFGTNKCLVKVMTKNGTATVDGAATIVTTNGINDVPGAGLLATIARTLGE